MSEHPTDQPTSASDDQWSGRGDAAEKRPEPKKTTPQTESKKKTTPQTERKGVQPSTSREPAKPPSAMKRQTRIGAAWVAVAVAVVVLVLLLIFILQNQQGVDVTYFGATGHLPLGVLVLLAAAGGALLVIVLGAARILQLQLLARRDRKVAKAKKKSAPSH